MACNLRERFPGPKSVSRSDGPVATAITNAKGSPRIVLGVSSSSLLQSAFESIRPSDALHVDVARFQSLLGPAHYNSPRRPAPAPACRHTSSHQNRPSGSAVADRSPCPSQSLPPPPCRRAGAGKCWSPTSWRCCATLSRIECRRSTVTPHTSTRRLQWHTVALDTLSHRRTAGRRPCEDARHRES